MYSFFFGSSGRKLYGVLESAPDAATGVLICGSWGPEAQAAHRFLRVLAKRLVAAGCSTMRFDYYGSGDSYGDARDLTLASMIADTDAALEELRAAGNVANPALIGFRLGALPALAVARESATQAVLLDPVLDGRRWLRAMESGPWTRPLEDGCLEAGGFVMGPRLREELQNGAAVIDPLESDELEAIVVSGGAGPELPTDKVTVIPSEPTWSLDNGFGATAVSPLYIDTVVERVARLSSDRV